MAWCGGRRIDMLELDALEGAGAAARADELAARLAGASCVLVEVRRDIYSTEYSGSLIEVIS